MELATVVYVDRSGSGTKAFTDRLAATAKQISNEGFEIIGVVPNAGMTETVGVWIFYKATAAPR